MQSTTYILQALLILLLLHITESLPFTKKKHSKEALTENDNNADTKEAMPYFGQVDNPDEYSDLPVKNCPFMCHCTYDGFELSVKCVFDPEDDLWQMLLWYGDLGALTANYCNLSNISCIISGLIKLQVLNLKGNDLVDVPWQCIDNLTKLQYLDLSYNDITTIADGSLYGLESLKSLDLGGNKISVIGPDLFLPAHHFPNLEYLGLNDNLISSVDTWPLELAANNPTIEIVLIGNSLSSFTNNFGNESFSCKDLKKAYMYLNRNNIRHFKQVFTGWNLSLSEPEEIKQCLNNVAFDVGENPLDCDCVDYEVYNYLQNSVHWYNYDQLVCNQPYNLKGWDPLQISLDSFICPIPEHCPENCSCISAPHTKNITVNCNVYNGSYLPDTLPSLPEKEYSYSINFDQNNLKYISYHPYLVKTTVAVFSNNTITNISTEAMAALQHVQILHLDNNKLTQLPSLVKDIKFKSLHGLRLGNNPWICNCETLATRDWVTEHVRQLEDAGQVICHSPVGVAGKNMISLDRNLYCKKQDFIPYVITGIVVVSVLVFLGITLGCFKKHKVWIYRKTNWHPLERDECQGEHKEFDIFVASANEDEEYVGEYLIPELERRGFKVCYHRVHFLAGKSITANICDSIKNSKRTLVFFSQDFLNSGFCMWEFSVALELDLLNSTNRLVAIKDTNVNIDDLDVTEQTYFQRATYVSRDAEQFWDNLLYTLPVNRMGVVQE